MFTTIEAEVDEEGQIRPTANVTLPPGSRVLITVLDADGMHTALLSEPALATDWQRPGKEAAWSLLGWE